MNYYSLANNYGRIAARVHFILKYSCALTICSKIKLRTLRGGFKKYGKNLTILQNGKKIDYPSITYKRPNIKYEVRKAQNVESLVDGLINRYSRHVGNLKGPCVICGSEQNIEVHHIRALKDLNKKKDMLSITMVMYSRKQVPVCKSCHIKIHKRQHDGKRL